VISALHRQHRAVEFRKFLIAIDKAVPAELDVHLVCDNLATLWGSRTRPRALTGGFRLRPRTD
jgi:hypothetical protein